MSIHSRSRLHCLTITAGAVCALGSAGAALAADVPVKAPPLAAAVTNWSGVYGGVHAGYGRGMTDWGGEALLHYDVHGFLGGGQIGVNQQIGIG